MSSLRTSSSPKKPSSDVRRVCGSSFAKHKRDKVSLFRCEANLHVILEEATGFPVRQDDGLPHFACTSCRTKNVEVHRAVAPSPAGQAMAGPVFEKMIFASGTMKSTSVLEV